VEGMVTDHEAFSDIAPGVVWMDHEALPEDPASEDKASTVAIALPYGPNP